MKDYSITEIFRYLEFITVSWVYSLIWKRTYHVCKNFCNTVILHVSHRLYRPTFNSGNWQTLFWGAPKPLQMVTAVMKLRHLLLGRKAKTNIDSISKSRDYFANKDLSSQTYGFSSSHVRMWELDYKESWEPKNWCFWMWCWIRLLRVPWTARRTNQCILKEISP